MKEGRKEGRKEGKKEGRKELVFIDGNKHNTEYTSNKILSGDSH